MEGTQQLSQISCKRCRVRKIRCDRLRPECTNCKEQHSECVYAQRKPRRLVRTNGDRIESLEAALSSMEERLQRIEQNCHFHSAHESLERLSRSATIPTNASQLQAESEPASNYMGNGGTPSDSSSGSSAYTPALQRAVEEVQRRVIQCQSQLTEARHDFHIQRTLAKSWIESYFDHPFEDLFPEFLNVKLIKLMPDIINLPGVHIDASVFVVYYCILYHGCFLYRHSTPIGETSGTMSKLYHQCLQAVSEWETCSTGTHADFIAAFFMVRVTAERFDIDLSWKMFKRACHYAEKIELHRLDSSASPVSGDPTETVLNAGRKGFWELINMDMYFQLIHNKPPVIVPGLVDAKVNLPWLAEVGSETGADITTARFLIDCRRTMILMDFFHLLENAKTRPEPQLVAKNETLCQNIEALYRDWEIDEWIRKMIDSNGQLWTIAGVALEGYTCILFMLRHVFNAAFNSAEGRVVDPDITTSPLALKASRYILEIVAQLLSAIPSVGTISVTFVVFQVHVPCTCLATHLLHSAAPQDYRADAALLERVACGLKAISSNAKEVSSLTTAIENLNEKVRCRLRENTST